MSKWKCEICGNEFENFYAQGFDRKIYCPLCYFKKENTKLINQQKEFIEYMNKTIEELECDNVDDEEMKGYLIQRIDTFKEILSKFKEIIGGKDE